MAIPFTVVSGAVLITDATGQTVDMISSNGIRMKTEGKILGRDGLLQADVTEADGLNALATTASISDIQLFDDTADFWLTINDAGASGNSLRIQIVGFVDPTAPLERNQPAVDVTVAVTASEAGQEFVLRDKIIDALNADSNFNSNWIARKVNSNPVVYITSRNIGEEGERTASNSYTLTPTGSVDVTPHNTARTILRKAKKTLGQKDTRDSRFLVQKIFGQVQPIPGDVGDIFIQNATDNGTATPDQGGTGDPDMQVNGSVGSPGEFFIPADADKDIFVDEMRFYGGGNGIQFDNFLSKNNTLTNGILVEVTSDGVTQTFLPIRSTEDFKNKWAFGSGDNFRLDIVSGTDQFLAVLRFDNPFPLRRLSGDEIRIKIQDNLNSGLTELEFIAVGFKTEAE